MRQSKSFQYSATSPWHITTLGAYRSGRAVGIEAGQR
jgi:hypothetical protein